MANDTNPDYPSVDIASTSLTANYLDRHRTPATSHTNQMDTSGNRHPNDIAHGVEPMTNPDCGRESPMLVDQETNDSRVQWDTLPQEILTKIFWYLTDCDDPDSVDNCCTAWRRANNVMSLWRRMEFNFDGSDSLLLVSKAFRILPTKGHFLRDLVITIGTPGLNQAWLMSECIQQLLDFISQKSSDCCFVESFTINNLSIFTQNRFFTLSKDITLTSLSNFLRSQRNLKRVSFTCCKFNTTEGMKILRTIKSSAFRHTIEKLDLKNFFKRRFITAARAFNFSNFSALEEISLDANYIDDYILRCLTDKGSLIQWKPLRMLKVHFDCRRRPPMSPSREAWLAAMASSQQELQVAFHFSGWLAYHWIKPFMQNAIPLVECDIFWKKLTAAQPGLENDLILLLDGLTTQNFNSLERFSISSTMRSSQILEDALLRLVSSCRRLSELTVSVTLSDNTVTNLATMMGRKWHKVKFRFLPPQRVRRGVKRNRGVGIQ